jgi:hypothetical protein
MTMTRVTCATAALAGLILHSAACGGSPAAPTASGPGPAGDPAAPTASFQDPTQPVSLVVGRPTYGVITATSQRCSYTLDTGTLEGPCSLYGVFGGWSKVGAPVNVRLTWTSDAQLALASPERVAPTGLRARAVCCESPLNIAGVTFPFDLTPIAVVYTGQPPLDARGVTFLLSATPR